MNELIIIRKNEEEQLVSARELYIFLEFDRSQWSRWYHKNIIEEEYFIENEDYKEIDIMSNGNKTKDFFIKIDMAKEICMLARNAKGKQARKYFIDIEKSWNSPERIMARALQIANKQIEEHKKTILEYKPKVEFYDQIIDSKDTIGIGELAKTLNLGIGRNKLFEILRDKNVLDRKNIPYQRFLDRGYFRTVETSYSSKGETRIHIKTVVFQKGVDWIRKLLK